MGDFTQLLMLMGIPSAVTAFCFWLVERKIKKRDEKYNENQKKKQEKIEQKEKVREESQYLLIQSVNAAIALAEATAKAVQRIPDAHCNGDMQSALEYAKEVKHEQKEFLARQGIHNIYIDKEGRS